MLSQMAEKAAFVNYIPRLTQATADDGEPTPAYLLDDIVKITYQSVTASHQLVDYLAHRLSKSSSTLVKIKVLKIILYVISNGHLSFREELQMHDGSIKNVLQHSGPLDPLLGNALYKDTQKLAQEALDLLFNPDIMAKEDSNPTAMENSQVFMAGMGASSPSSGKYEGFGNTPKDREGTVADKMLDYLGRLIHSSDEHTNEAIRAALHSSPGDYQPIVVAEVLTDPVLSSEIPTMKASFVKNHVPGRAGGGWESDEDEDNNVGIVLTESELSSSILSTHQDSPDCFHARSSSQVEDITQNEAQSIILHFKNTPGLPTLEELDKMCAKCATVGFSETFNAVSKINLDLTSYSTEGQLLRILFLYEWFFFYLPDDHDKGLTETLNDLIKDQNLPALCKSKARKVKLLYERSRGIL